MKVILAIAFASALAVPLLSGSLLDGAIADPNPPHTKTASPAVVSAATEPETDERAAQASFERLQATYQHLDDVTIRIGDTPNGEEAVSYYTVGEIVIDANHTVSIDKILAHEIWHVIDWRDNGQLDWGEDLPPTNSSDYQRR